MRKIGNEKKNTWEKKEPYAGTKKQKRVKTERVKEIKLS